MAKLVGLDKIQSRGCLSINCEGAPLLGGLCARHLEEMRRALR